MKVACTDSLMMQSRSMKPRELKELQLRLVVKPGYKVGHFLLRLESGSHLLANDNRFTLVVQCSPPTPLQNLHCSIAFLSTFWGDRASPFFLAWRSDTRAKCV